MIAGTIALGTWGFSRLVLEPSQGATPAVRLSFIESLYHAVKLYTLELGPADGEFPAAGPNWQIVIAFALAVALVLRALLALAGERVRRLVARRVLRGHVIVCGAGVHGARLARDLAADHDVVLVDVDPAAAGLRGAVARNEWRLVGDAVEPDTLRGAGAARANWLIALTGDDFVNSQIVSAVHALGGVRAGLHVLVQVEDPSLARFLEEEDPPHEEPARGVAQPGPAAPVVTPFSADAIAAEALLATLRRKTPDGGEGLLLEPAAPDGADGSPPHLILAGDHPLLDALALGALRRWRVLMLRAAEAGSRARRPPLRVSVYGPGAVERVERLHRRFRPESSIVELEARDADPAGEAQIEEDDWLRDRDGAGHAVVACAEELDGVRLTLAISRALGDGVLMTRVTTQAESVLDRRLRDRTAASSWLATTDVRAVADLAGDRRAIAGAAARRRLEVAVGAALGDPGRAHRVAAELLARGSLRIHTDLAWRVPPAERVLLEPLVAPAPVSAFVDAGLAVDLEGPENLRRAAEGLTAAHASETDRFMAWCEYARAVGDDAPDAVRAGLEREAGDGLGDAVLRLRRAVLAGGGGRAGGLLAGAERVLILAGAAARMTEEQRELLEPLLARALAGYDGVLLSGGTDVGLPGIAGAVARELGLRAVGYVPEGRGEGRLYGELRETAGTGDFSVREPLAMWADIAAAGIDAASVCVVACPGGPITDCEVLLGRALGAHVGWLDPAGDAPLPLEDALPFGAAGVLELPADAMTLRALIRRPTGAERLDGEALELLARQFHAAYRRNQRRRKAAGDPAMAPWDELLPALQRSNLALADDVPAKLALVGRRLARPGERLELADDEVELLAEAEHGRYNVERLEAGWQSGDRHLLRRVSPHLRPWDELSEEARQYDREAVRTIDAALAAAGWGVTRA